MHVCLYVSIYLSRGIDGRIRAQARDQSHSVISGNMISSSAPQLVEVVTMQEGFDIASA